MKLVVAYIEPPDFEPIREELLSLGFVSLSASDASGSLPEPAVTGSYRGAAMENHLRPKTRVECVVGSDQVATVVSTVLGLAAERRFVFVLPLEEAHPVDTVSTGTTLAADAG